MGNPGDKHSPVPLQSLEDMISSGRYSRKRP